MSAAAAGLGDAHAIAATLGGQVVRRDTVLASGPGHSPRDSSPAVRLDPAAPGGFLIYSHAGDDWRAVAITWSDVRPARLRRDMTSSRRLKAIWGGELSDAVRLAVAGRDPTDA
jgi:hypothetical protein